MREARLFILKTLDFCGKYIVETKGVCVMVFAISDLHGCYDKYVHMLEKIALTDEDTLYVLGDVVDRGEGGIRILKDMMGRRNVIPLRGNHDYMAHRMLHMVKNAPDAAKSGKSWRLHQMWLLDGGETTQAAFMALTPKEQDAVLAYMDSFLIYDEVEAGGRAFFLAHTVPAKERMMDFSRLLWQEFIVGEPEYDQEYFRDRYVVTGHTPTGLIDPSCSGRIIKMNNHIAIDCGAVSNHPLGCICLDTLEEFYVD